MAKNVQIRNVPDPVHKKLKGRAAAAGMSLSEYLLGEVSHLASLPTMAEMMARLEGRDSVKLRMSAASAVRRERDSA